MPILGICRGPCSHCPGGYFQDIKLRRQLNICKAPAIIPTTAEDKKGPRSWEAFNGKSRCGLTAYHQATGSRGKFDYISRCADGVIEAVITRHPLPLGAVAPRGDGGKNNPGGQNFLIRWGATDTVKKPLNSNMGIIA